MRVFTLGLMAFISNAIAQESALERIEVTAQKRPQSLQQVPISVTAISAEQINQYSLEDVQSIASMTPNLTATRAISGMSNYFIRGIGLDDFNLSSVPAIGIYLDDVAIHNPMLANFALHDLQRVEVLRGPQNALYGKNTTGGAIHFISTQSQSGFRNGYAKLNAGEHGQVFIDLASNFDITDETSLRVSGFKHLRDGIVKSTVEGNNTAFGNIDRQGIKVNLNHDIGQDWQLNIGLYGGKQNQVAEVKTVLVANQSGIIDLDDVNLELNGSELINPRNDIDALGGFIKVSHDSDSVIFSSLTSIELVKSERMDDWGAQGTPAGVYQSITYNSSDTRFWSQEFQWKSANDASLKWLAGIAFNRASGEILQTAYIDPAGQGRPDDGVLDAGIGPLFDRGALVKDDSQSYSLYGQITIPIESHWRATAAYRWTRQHLKPKVHSVGMMMDLADAPYPLGSFGWYSVGNNNFNVFRDYAGFEVVENFVNENGGYPAMAQINKTFNEWGGKFAIDYQLLPDMLIYGSVARGFKMGAVNSNPTTAAYASMLTRAAEPEALVTYELGIKSQWLSDRLRINGAIFENHWQDYQFYLVYNPGNPVDLFATLVNLPKAESKGAELEVNWLLSDTAALSIGIGWLDTEVVNGELNTDGVPAGSISAFQDQVIAGNELTNSPQWNINSVLNKSFNIQGSELNLALHYNFIDEHIHILAGKHSENWQRNFSERPIHLIGLSASFHFGKQEQFQAILWGRNITDEQYCMERAVIPGTDSESVRGCVQGEGRQVGVTLVYNFD